MVRFLLAAVSATAYLSHEQELVQELVDSAGNLAGPKAEPGEQICCCNGMEPEKFVCIDTNDDGQQVLLPSAFKKDSEKLRPPNAEAVERRMIVTTEVLGSCNEDGTANIFAEDPERPGLERAEETAIPMNQHLLQRSTSDTTPMHWSRYALPEDQDIISRGWTSYYSYLKSEHVIVDDDVIYREVPTSDKELASPDEFGEGSPQCTRVATVPVVTVKEVKRLKQPTNETAFVAKKSKCELQTVCLQYSFGHACGWDRPRGRLFKRVGRVGQCLPADDRDGTCPGKMQFSTKQSTGKFGSGGFRFCDCRDSSAIVAPTHWLDASGKNGCKHI
jgi:hypothetical protein